MGDMADWLWDQAELYLYDGCEKCGLTIGCRCYHIDRCRQSRRRLEEIQTKRKNNPVEEPVTDDPFDNIPPF